MDVTPLSPAQRAAPWLVPVAFAFATSGRFFALDSQSLPWLNAWKSFLAALDLAGLILVAWMASGAGRRPTDTSDRRALIALAGALAVLALALSALHPYFDRPELQAANLGGDRDDALIDAARRLLALEDPYAAPTYTRTPISPGPGWVLLNLIAGIPGLFPLLVPLHAALLTAVVARAGYGVGPTLLATLFCLGSAGFWENAYGSDLSALALALATCTVAAFSFRRHAGLHVLLPLLAGALATARLPLLLYPAWLGVLLWSLGDRRSGLVTAILGTATALLLHGIFGVLMSRAGPYPPFHLLDQGMLLFGPGGLAAGLAGLAAFALVAARQALTSVAAALWRQGLILLLAFGSISLAAIAAAGGRLDGIQDWTGYAIVALPSLVLARTLYARGDPSR